MRDEREHRQWRATTLVERLLVCATKIDDTAKIYLCDGANMRARLLLVHHVSRDQLSLGRHRHDAIADFERDVELAQHRRGRGDEAAVLTRAAGFELGRANRPSNLCVGQYVDLRDRPSAAGTANERKIDRSILGNATGDGCGAAGLASLRSFFQARVRIFAAH